MPTQFHLFKNVCKTISTPKKFPYLHTHKPHELCIIAGKEVQEYLEKQNIWNKQLGVNQEPKTVGKMFGVLVVQQQNNTLGYLAGFSGAIGTCNTHPYFVPPIFNLLNPNGFFKHEENKLNILNNKIKNIEESQELLNIKQEVELAMLTLESTQKNWKLKLKIEKQLRQEQRKLAIENLTEPELTQKLETLNKASQLEKIKAKKHIAKIKEQLSCSEKKLQEELSSLIKLKEQRKKQSANLQYKIFSQFKLLNSKLESKSVTNIFKEQNKGIPPAGTGDCAAPKLLQFAFKHKLKPIALAEFWWGAPPKSEIRKHKQFYPPCNNKCTPIMSHMLKYIEQDENPIEIKSPSKLDIIYEDNWLIAINKPQQFLSTPGKTQSDSVLQRLKQMYPNANGALLVHRLDMATSGILLAAKNAETHKALQDQFIKRTTQKCYIAILNGILEKDSGTISLPLRVDINNRPQQLVCYKHGKSTITKWKVIERKDNKTRVEFYPITGRTHQLRVHAAHVNGLNTAIVGDQLYGTASDRLYLHAHWLKIVHPHTGKQITFIAPKPF